MENASNYLTILLNDIQQSINTLASYNNMVLMLQAKYGLTIDPNKLTKIMTESDRATIIQVVGLFRTYITRVFVEYNSIKNNFKNLSIEDKEKIIVLYNHISSTPIPDYNKSQEFVQIQNDLFVNEINVQALINVSQKQESLASNNINPNLENGD